jgi:ribosomal protein S12
MKNLGKAARPADVRSGFSTLSAPRVAAGADTLEDAPHARGAALRACRAESRRGNSSPRRYAELNPHGR